MPLHRVENESLSRGLSGTTRTIERMHKLVGQGKLDPTMHRIATWIRLSVPEDQRGNSRELANAIFWFAKKHGVFQQDPFQIERIEHPIEAMRPVIEGRQAGTYNGPALFVGDCDLFSIMVATLGGILGYQYAFETAKLDQVRTDEFSHVWPALLVHGDWIALDASTSSAVPGWRPPMRDPGRQFKRWEEKPIEDVVTMSEFGGDDGIGGDAVGLDGMSDIVEVPNYEPSEATLDQREFVHGRRRFYGNEPGADTVIPEVDPGVQKELVEDQPAESSARIEGGFDAEFQNITYRPSDRVEKESALMDPNAYPPPRYRPGPANSVHVENAYPTGWPWARQAETVYDGQRMQSVIPSAGAAGMGDFGEPKDNYSYAGVSPSPATVEAQQSATAQVASTIADVIKTVAGTVSAVDQATLAYKQRQLEAQAMEASQRIASQMPIQTTTPNKLTTTQVALIGGGVIVAIGGALYLLSK